jgi:hypothetical protein
VVQLRHVIRQHPTSDGEQCLLFGDDDHHHDHDPDR